MNPEQRPSAEFDLHQDSRVSNSRRADGLALACLAAIVGIAVGFRWYFDNWLSDFDILTMFLPWFGYVGDRVGDFQVPAWNRFDSAGFSMIGNSSGGWMYLPVMLAFGLFEVLTAFKVMVLIQATISAVAIYGFARRIGLLPVAALSAGIVFAIGASLYSATIYLPIAGQVLTFLAVGMLSAEMALHSRHLSGVLGWSALGAVAASQVFAAWPGQGLVYSAMYIGGWLLFRCLFFRVETLGSRRDHVIRSGIYGIVAAVGAFGFGAATILPQLEFIRQSNISGGDYSNLRGGDYVSDTWSPITSYQNLLQDVFIQRPYGLSIVVVMLAIVAIVRCRGRFGTPYFAVMTFLFIDLASSFSLTRWLFNIVPLFESMHNHRPTATIALLSFGPAMLAGAAIQAIVTSRSRWSVTYLALGAIPVLMAIGNVVSRDRLFVGWWPVVFGFLTLIAIAAVTGATSDIAPLRRLPSFRVGLAALLILLVAYPTGIDFARTALDSTAAPDYDNLITRDDSVQSIVETSMSRNDPGGAGEALKYAQSTETPFRFVSFLGDDSPDGDYLPSSERRLDIYVVASLANGRASRLGLEQVSGYNPIHLEYYVDYIAAMNGTAQDYHWLDVFAKGVDGNQLLNMLGARFIVIPTNLAAAPPIAASGTEVFRNDYAIVYKNPAAFERAWLVHDVRPDDGTGLQQLASGSVDGHATAFVHGALPQVSPVATGADADWLVFEDRSAEMLRFKVGTSQPAMAVISQAYEEGWVAYVDGQETDILRTDHALMGVPVAAGEHRIELRYEPKSLTIGLWSTGATSIVLVCVWIWAALSRFVFGATAAVGAKRPSSDSVRLAFSAALAWFQVRRVALAWIVTTTVLVLIAFGFKMKYDNWTADFDILTFFLPNYGYIGDRLASLQLPSWNPYESGGSPMMGNPSGGWMFLPVMLTFSLFNALLALKAMILIDVLVAALAMLAIARRLGLGWAAASAAAVIFAAGNVLNSATTNATIYSQSLAFLALTFLATDVALTARRWSLRCAWACLAGVGASQIIIAWPSQGALHAGLILGGWIVFRMLFPLNTGESRIPPKTTLVTVAIIGATTLAISASALLAILNFSSASTVEGGSYADLIGGDYADKREQLGFIFRLLTVNLELWRGSAISAVTMILALCAVPRVRTIPAIGYFAVSALFLIEIASSTSVFVYLLTPLPLIGDTHLHRPLASVAFVCFPISILAAYGIQYLTTSVNVRQKQMALCGSAAVFGLFAAAAAIGGYRVGWLPIILGAILVIIAMIGIQESWQNSVDSDRWRTPSVFAVALLGIVIFYPMAFDIGEVIADPTSSPDWDTTFAHDQLVQDRVGMVIDTGTLTGAETFLRAQQSSGQTFRIAVFPGGYDGDPEKSSAARSVDPQVIAVSANGRPLRLELEQISGYNPLHLKYYTEYIDALNQKRQDYHWLDLMTPAVQGSPLLDMLNVRYVLAPADLQPQPGIASFGTIAYQDSTVIVYENPRFYERAWLVHDVRNDGDDTVLSQLSAGSVDGRVTAFVNGDLPAVEAPAQGSAADQVTIVDTGEEDLTLVTSSSANALAVISQSYEANWVAYVDGKKTDILRTNHALMGVPVTAGEHRIELRYEPEFENIGLLGTGSSAIVVVGIWIWAVIDRRRYTSDATR